jgi:hypothetical protein
MPSSGLLNGPSSGKIIRRNNANWFNILAGAAAEMNEEYSFATPGVEKGRSTWITKEHLKLEMKLSSKIW